MAKPGNGTAQENGQQQHGIRSPGDGLNQKIIRMLEIDGRLPFSEIAQKLEVSEGTIRNRVSALRNNNMLRIVAMVDPVATEYKTDALVGITVASGTTPAQVAERLRDDARVVFVLWVAGRYDLIVEIVSDESDALQSFLETEIHAASDVASAEVMPGLKNFKNQFLLKRDWRAADA